MRTVLCHYHIYKNAGTSFDHVLQTSFGARHLAFDGPFPFFTIDQEQLDRIISRKAEAVAFSSHQIQLPAPVAPGYRVVSVVFLRNPFLRIASIWRFKRAHPDGTTTSAAACRLGLADWIRHCLDDPVEIGHVSNAQTRLLAAPHRGRAVPQRAAEGLVYDIGTAVQNLSGATLVGRTESFGEDVRRIAGCLAAEGLPLTLPEDLHRNATERTPVDPGARTTALFQELGPDLAARLQAANRQDLELRDLADRLAAQAGRKAA